MPLSKIQTGILRLLASHRDPESYVAGATPLNRNSARYSEDIDVFHDREDRVASAALNDAHALERAGYGFTWLRRSPLIYTAAVTQENLSTRLEWVADSDFRFFPTMRDELFGYLLHPVDLATNKVMAAVGRREVRDLADLIIVHKTILPLGAAIWAAVEKSPGFTPEGLIAEVRRNLHVPAAEWRALAATEPFDPQLVTQQLRAALDEAETFVARMPTNKMGLLFLESGKWCSPSLAALRRLKLTPDKGVDTGLQMLKLPRLCLTITTKTQALRSLSASCQPIGDNVSIRALTSSKTRQST